MLEIYDFLDSNGIRYSIGGDDSEFFTYHCLGKYDIAVKVKIPKNFPCSLPSFHLVNRENFGGLAHVGWGECNDDEICYGKDNNFNTDFHDPVKVFSDTLNRALATLDKSLNDKDHNERELFREFAGVWRCHIPLKSKRLICLAEPADKPVLLDIRSSIKGAKGYFGGAIFAVAPSSACNDKNFFSRCSQEKGRSVQGKGVSIPLSPLMLPPVPDEAIGPWWLKQLSALSEENKKNLKKLVKKTNTREFYILCHGEYKGDTIWFAIYCKSSTKQYAPITSDNFGSWEFQAVKVDMISQKLLVPRGGGASDLGCVKICIVGCGSVGGYVADMLASSGVGQLTLIDNDLFKIENLHRHVSNPIYLYCLKANAIKDELEHKYPFVKINSLDKQLVEIEETRFWEQFDAVIVAIGAAAHERKFNEFIRDNQINTPVINTWVEPFGVGGHAVATIPEQKGCLACTYLNNESDMLDLYSNLSFVEREQHILKSLGGCGTEFVAFSSIDAIQTATIASKLCIRSIKGELPYGIAVSWRSDSTKAKEEGVRFTHRYLKMVSNMKDIKIARSSCPVCGDV